MPQRREYRRFDVDAKLDLKTDNGMRRILHAYLDDIGLGGFRLYSEDKIAINKDVQFAVMTPLLNRPLLGRGRIRHINAVKLYGTRFFSMGVKFTRINRKKIKHLIKTALGWHIRPFLSQQHRRELSFMLRLLPVIIIIIWPILKASDNFYYSNTEEQQYRERLRNAEIYYLYHSHKEESNK